MVSPEYSAVIECVPPESALVTHAEFPCTTGSAVHPAMAPAPSRKLMRPAGDPAVPGTVAVKVTACPPFEGLGEPVRIVVEDRVGLNAGSATASIHSRFAHVEPQVYVPKSQTDQVKRWGPALNGYVKTCHPG